MAKEFTYRGKTLEELQKMDVREFGKYLPSRERRSVLRQFQEIEKFISRCQEKINRKKPIKTHDRWIVITPQLVGMSIQIHKGNGFENVKITEDMMGHRLGEFTVTRSKVKHGAAGIGATRSSASRSVK